MNKVQLVDAIAAKTGLSKKDAAAAVDAFTSTVKDSVKRGDTVQLIGFGSFKRVTRKARKCINPKTGETIKVPAKKVAKFTVGTAFTEQLNSKTTSTKKAPAKKPTTKSTAKKSTTKKPTASKKTVAKKTTAKKPTTKKVATKKK